MNHRNLILAGLLCGLASCADAPPPRVQEPPWWLQQSSPSPVVQQPTPVVQQQTRTPQQVDALMRVQSSERSCVAYGNDLIECELRAQLMETCLETHNYAPCSNLPPMQRESARPTPRESECHWEFERWVCREQ